MGIERRGEERERGERRLFYLEPNFLNAQTRKTESKYPAASFLKDPRRGGSQRKRDKRKFPSSYSSTPHNTDTHSQFHGKRGAEQAGETPVR